MFRLNDIITYIGTQASIRLIIRQNYQMTSRDEHSDILFHGTNNNSMQ